MSYRNSVNNKVYIYIEENYFSCRNVTSIDGMTSDWASIPWDVLEKVSVRLVNEVQHINRVLYDITSKPPATIEWE
ncbi:hypothetical protein [Psychrobacillus psychrodurans]|uniref:GMP synthase (glutamine-hydrolyzing) n=1 Tax=Psychrobacillus psychrodurans TaxID=126157 RepID=UPI003D0265AE